jgi:pSer/pThr/pTyr-binding forkhead associated (FHA) protein
MTDEDNLTKVRMALPRFILRGVSGASFGKTFPVYRTTVLGRHSDCGIPLSGEGLSRRHAEISIEGSTLLVKDLGSANGTFINDERIEEGELKFGDELRLDTVRFLVQSPDGRSALETPPPPPDPVPENTGGNRMVPWIVGGTVVLAAIVAALLLSGVI